MFYSLAKIQVLPSEFWQTLGDGRVFLSFFFTLASGAAPKQLLTRHKEWKDYNVAYFLPLSAWLGSYLLT